MKELFIKKRHYILPALIVLMMFSSSFYLSELHTFEDISSTHKDSVKKTSSSASSGSAGESSNEKRITYEPLTSEEKEKIIGIILSNEMIKAIPEKSPLSIQFFHFNYGYRTWQDKFIVAKGEIVDNKEPVIKLTLHSKYLKEFDTKDFCQVIQDANANRDLGFESKESKSSLLWKYKNMLKYRDCIGL